MGLLVELTPPATVAAAALNRARAAARARGLRPGDPPRRTALAIAERQAEAAAGGSGAHPSARDPQPVAATLGRLLDEAGWRQDVLVGGVVGRWADIVGPQVAEHCVVERFGGGELVVRTDSTAWAAQMRLLAPTLLGRLAQTVGEGVVVEVTVLGPTGPGFGRGPRSVRGRGPRDTWG
ncbi:hypothetical protein Cma02nite_31790 [Cellulomonas marina]|uniref:Predicted nucleic acid-binding protein, contains Zn-ribbon domain (Includes truncated derivatives) n=1 Tax=Cellulomonas marina TaxID=988821 RepID=A0A1I1A8Y3_9CELL|nr:hypothetical protein Cma02nite_31790 [Cellulomonas marina]SFB34377.1 Predicted nucleic acid-binding protein, contains Zn-ribbon domain (includes truncated derivatives) [Cellulomonas marina]